MVQIINYRCRTGWLLILVVALLSACSIIPTEETDLDESYGSLYRGSSENKTANEAAIAADTPEEAIARGDEAYSKRQYDIALYEYVDALKLNGGDTETLNKVGDIHFTLGDLDSAEQAYKGSLQLDEVNQHALQGLGLIQLRLRNYEQAKASLLKALAQNPNLWSAHNGLGMIADIEGDHATAIEHYHQALALNPRSAQVLNNLGYSEYLSGNWHAAMMHFVQAVNSNPDYERAWYNIGLIYTREGDYENAFDAFRNVLDTPQSYNDIGYLSMIDGQYNIAERYFQKAVKSSPSYYLKAHENIDKLERLRDRGPATRQFRTRARPTPVKSQTGNTEDAVIAVSEAGMPVVTVASVSSSAVIEISPDGNATVAEKTNTEAVLESSQVTDTPQLSALAEVSQAAPAIAPESQTPAPEEQLSVKPYADTPVKPSTVTDTPQLSSLAEVSQPASSVVSVSQEPEPEEQIVVNLPETAKTVSSPTDDPDINNTNSDSAFTSPVNQNTPVNTIATATDSRESLPESPVSTIKTKEKSSAYSTQGEQADYRKALAMVRDGQFEDAAESFNFFLQTYPDSSYIDNANYWIGETYYVTRDFEPALETFTVLIEKYPDSPKVPDARLKIGYIHYEQHDWPAAREVLSSIVSAYPDTEVAQLANARLIRIEDEAH